MLLRIAKFHLKRKGEKEKNMHSKTLAHIPPSKMRLNSAASGAERGVLFLSQPQTVCKSSLLLFLEYVCYYIKLISQLRLIHAYLQLDGNPETDNSWIQNSVSMMHALCTKWNYVLQFYQRIISNAFNYTKYISILILINYSRGWSWVSITDPPIILLL